MGITPVLRVNPDDFAQEELAPAGRILREGGLVVFPTETVYGLGANALDETAARAIYTAKGRPSDNPLIVHLPDLSRLDMLCRDIPKQALSLFSAFSPSMPPLFSPPHLFSCTEKALGTPVCTGVPSTCLKL